jgi:hypothetical protein
MREVSFNELIKIKQEDIDHDVYPHEAFEQGALFARQVILDLILKINADNYNSDGEPINESCRLDAEALENISHLIRYGNFYETDN